LAKFLLDIIAVISLIENKDKKVMDHFEKTSIESENEILSTILNCYEFLRRLTDITDVRGRSNLVSNEGT